MGRYCPVHCHGGSLRFCSYLFIYYLTFISETKQSLSVATTAIISSVLSSFVFFIFGLLCGQIMRLFRRQPFPSENLQDYEVVSHIANSQETCKEVTLQPNEAYGQLSVHN